MTATLERLDHDTTDPITDNGRFQAYAVRSRTGPHVTMQAGVVHAGRFWTTSSASSLKARSVVAHGDATAVITLENGHRIVSGPTIALPPFRPWKALKDPLAAVLAGPAIAHLGISNTQQLIGYLEASGLIPLEWLPTRRVLLVTKIERSLTLQNGMVVDATGTWSRAAVHGALGTVPVGGSTGGLPEGSVSASHRPVVRSEARVHLGVATPTGPVALPARWVGDDRFAVSADALGAITADLSGRGTAVFDQSTSRRPDEKLGVMFRGSLRLADLDGDDALVGLSTERITTWDGFEASTVDAETMGVGR